MLVRICRKSLLLALFSLALARPAYSALININTAPPAELETLEGIGPSYADRIVDYRETVGPFDSKIEIMNVSGIGEATYLKIKDFITVGSSDSSAAAKEIEDSEISKAEHSDSQEEDPDFYSFNDLSIGRDRIGSTGSPMEFKVESGAGDGRKSDFYWNFGDGSTATGKEVTHTYKYPGQYVVVLDVSVSGREKSTRIDVQVTEPKIIISSASADRIEIKNLSDKEVNLFGRALISGEDIFIIPKDTILKPEAEIYFSSEVTSLHPASAGNVGFIMLEDPEDIIEVKSEYDEYRRRQMSSLRQKIADLRKKIAEKKVSKISDVIVEAETEEIETVEKSGSVEGPALGAESRPTDESLLGIIKKFFLRK